MAQEKKELDLGGEPVGKLLIRLAIPAILAQFVSLAYSIINRMYIGRIEGVGDLALAGVGVSYPVLILIAAFSVLIGMGGAPRASIKMGEKDFQGAEQILGNCFVSTLGIAVVLTAAFLLFGRQILLAFGASENTIGYAWEYTSTYVCGTVFVQIAYGLNFFISAQGFAKYSMLTVLIGAVANLILDPIFIFVLRLGVRGAALATVVSQGLAAAWVLRFLTGKKTYLRIRRENLNIKPAVMLPVLALGVAPFIMQGTESLLNVVFNASLRRYGGDIAVGAMTILSSLMQILLLPLNGLTQGAQPILSYNFGAKHNDRVRRTFRLLVTSAMVFTTLYWLALELFPRAFVSLFAKNEALLTTTTWAVRIYMAGTFILGAQTTCQQTLVAVGQAKISLFLALLRKVILLIPLVLILPRVLTDPLFGIFLSGPIADLTASIVTITIVAVKLPKILKKNLLPKPQQGDVPET